MLTPRASSAGGAFTIECPASNVLCHRQGTVCETSGFRHRLARLRQPPALADSCFSQACVDPVDQNRAGAEWFKNSTAHDSERLSSYQRARRVLSREPMLPPGCPREASNTAYPFARHLPRCFVFFLRDPPSKGASALVELGHVSPYVSFNATRPQPKIRLTDVCNPTFQR